MWQPYELPEDKKFLGCPTLMVKIELYRLFKIYVATNKKRRGKLYVKADKIGLGVVLLILNGLLQK